MLEVYGDLWTYNPIKNPLHDIPAICITTNGYVKVNGKAVMGRGIAKQCLERFPGIDKDLGWMIATRGHKVLCFRDAIAQLIYSFPTKHHWREKADLDLIKLSAEQLADMAIRRPWRVYILPRPGCSNGQRDWLSEVRPIIEPILPDNVHVITNQPYYNRS